MKFKSTLLTLLVVGLVLSLSTIVSADAVISLKAQNNDVYTIDDEAAAFGEMPLLRFSVTNTEGSSITIEEITVTNGTLTTNGDRFNGRVWLDANDNGMLDDGDTALVVASALAAAAAAPTTYDIADQTIAAGDSAHFIVTGAKLATAITADDGIELILNDADALTLTGGETIADNAVADPGNDAYVPSLIVADGVGSMTADVHSNSVLEVADFPNLKSDVIVQKFNLEADATVSHVLEVVVLTADLATTDPAAADADFDNARLYVDLNSNGVVDVTDAELTLSTTAFVTAGANTYTLTTPVFVPADGDYDFIMIVDGEGMAADGDELKLDLTVGSTLFDGAVAAGGAAAGEIMTMKALTVTLETGDLTGPPFSRPNGYLDNIKATFSAAIEDATFDAGDWDVAGHVIQTFIPTYNGDVADNDYLYIKIDDAVSKTSDTPDVEYDGSHMVVSLDGDYALPAFTGGDAVSPDDAAPPAPLNVITVDAGLGTGDAGNGKLDGLYIQFSEALAGASAASGAGLTVTGYDVDGASPADPLLGDWAGTATLWKVELGELADYDTDAEPDYIYNDATGTLADANGVLVKTFNQLNIPTVDKIAPTVVHAKTIDGNNNGQFDTLEIGLSEPIRLNPADGGLTEADVVDNAGADGFNFGAGHDATYDFVGSGNTGLGTMTLTLPVNEVGSYDTAVMPSLIFAAGNLADYASTPNLLAAATFVAVDSAAVVTAADEVWVEDAISARITSAATVDNAPNNGRLDGMKLIFSEAMGTDAATYKTMTVAGYVIESATISSANVTLVLEEIESGYDTGVVPQVTYSPGTVVDANGAALGTLDAAAVAEVDNAYPLLMKAATGDRDHDGKIDMLNLTFSELMDTTGVNYDGTSSLNDEITLAGYTLDQDSLVVFSSDRKTAKVYLDEGAVVDTDATPVLTYAQAGAKILKDKATPQLTLADVAALTTKDAAAPVPVVAMTVDKNKDGFLDGVSVTFTEIFAIDEDDSAKVQMGVALTKQSNAIDLEAAAISKDATSKILTLVGTSAMGAGKWDTGKKPYMHILADNGITDAAGNVVAVVDSFLTTDGAAPILAMARAQIEDTEIDLVFSELVEKSTGVALDATSVEYINILDEDNPVVITDIDDDNSDKVTFEATTDSTVTLAHATTDKVAPVAANVIDLVGNAVYVDSIAISDNARPVMLLATTMDLDDNGLIETIKLVFDEAIKDANLVGYTGAPDTLGFHTGEDYVSDFWTLEDPFQVIGYNFTHSPETGDADSLADIATAHARLQLIPGSVDRWIKPYEIVPNVEDTPNDTILYLLVRDTNFPVEGNTGAKPDISYQGTSAPPFGGGVGDFKPNFVSSFEDTTKDGAAPVLLAGAMDSTGTIMTVTVSEKMQAGLPLARDAFLWSVGDQELDYGTLYYIVNFNQPSDHTLMFEVAIGNALGAGVTSTLNYRGASSIKDHYLVWNEYAAGRAIDIDPSTGVEPVAEEADEALPNVYALGQNFPNPFNPTTTISYDVAGDGGLVSLVIYNVNGQKVRTLVNEVKTPGFYKMVWDGRNDLGESVASGVYLYKMISGDFSKIQKMTFIK